MSEIALYDAKGRPLIKNDRESYDASIRTLGIQNDRFNLTLNTIPRSACLFSPYTCLGVKIYGHDNNNIAHIATVVFETHSFDWILHLPISYIEQLANAYSQKRNWLRDRTPILSAITRSSLSHRFDEQKAISLTRTTRVLIDTTEGIRFHEYREDLLNQCCAYLTIAKLGTINALYVEDISDKNAGCGIVVTAG